MKFQSSAMSGIALCALLLALDSFEVLDLGYFANGLALIILGLAASMLASMRSVKDEANG